jgi:hypothetical protein
MPVLFSAPMINAWREQSEKSPEELYSSVIGHVNALFSELPLEASDLISGITEFTPEDRQIKTPLLANIKNIYDHCANENERLRLFARETLVSARLLLAIINNCFHNHQVSPNTQRFFDRDRLAPELARGAHALIEDDGALFDALVQLGISQQRFSSHYPDQKKAEYLRKNPDKSQRDADIYFQISQPDHSLRAPTIFNEFLFGEVIMESGERRSWFQFEGHACQPRDAYESRCLQLLDRIFQFFSYSIEKFLHHVDYLKYRVTGRVSNIGQYGNSEYVESAPIYLIPASNSP